MSIALEVGLLSGKTVTVTADLEEDIGTLKFRAQTALGVGNGRLVDSSRNVLDAGARIKDARVQKGDALTLHISQVQVQASELALAAILGDGSVVTWGAAFCGGVSSSVQEQLKNVEKIQASGYAFAAIRGDGSVVTWGMAVRGGDSGAVQDHLKQVRQIHASEGAFAAVRCDGPKSRRIHCQEWQQRLSQWFASAAHSSAVPVQHHCHHHGEHDPRSRRIHRKELQQKRHQLGYSAHSAADAAQSDCHHHKDHDPRSRLNHRQEWPQKHLDLLGSAAHSSADPAQRYCHRPRQQHPRSRPNHRQEWLQKAWLVAWICCTFRS